MIRYRTLEHTADRAVMLFGTDERTLLRNAAWAVIDQVCDARRVRRREKREVKVTAVDPTVRLVGVMNSLLYYFDTESLLLPYLVLRRVAGGCAHGVAWGEPLEERHRYKGALKAATYHDIRIERTRRGLRARVVLDV